MNPNPNPISDDTFALQITQAARAIQPDSHFAAALEDTLRRATPTPRLLMPPVLRVMASAAAVLIVMAVGVVYVPPLRAIAEEIIGFVKRASSDQTTMLLGDTPLQTQVFASIPEAEAILLRDFVMPSQLPTVANGNSTIKFEIKSVIYVPDYSILRMEYLPLVDVKDDTGRVIGQRTLPNITWYMSFSQSPSATFQDTGGILIGESAEIETVAFKFKGHPVNAQFYRGIWNSYEEAKSIEQALARGEKVLANAVWVDDGTMQLMWEFEGTIYSLQTRDTIIVPLTRDDLIRIAESIE